MREGALAKLCAQSRGDIVRCGSRSQAGTSEACGRRLYTVRQISRSATIVDVVHKHAQLLLHLETYWQPV